MNEKIEARREAAQKSEERMRKTESGSIEQLRVAESRKEKQKINWRRQIQIKLHETKFYNNKQNEKHDRKRNGGRNEAR